MQQLCGSIIPISQVPQVDKTLFKLQAVKTPVRYVYIKQKVVERSLSRVATNVKYTFRELQALTGLSSVQLRRLLSQYHHEGKVYRTREKYNGKIRYIYIFTDTTPEPILNSSTNFDIYEERIIKNPSIEKCIENLDDCNYYINDIQVRVACLYLTSVTYASCISLDRESPTTFYLNLRGNIYLYDSYMDKRRELELINKMINGVMYFLTTLSEEYEKNPQKAIPDIADVICDFSPIDGIPVIDRRLFPVYASADIPFTESGCELPTGVDEFNEIHVESPEFGVDECLKWVGNK